MVRGPAQNLLLSLVSLLLLVALLELAFRQLDLRGHFPDRRRGYDAILLPVQERLRGLSRQFRPDSEFEIGYDSDPRGYFGPDKALRYRVNRWGFRGPDWPEQKAPGTLRLLLLGDSFVFGEGVRWEDTLGERLGAALTPALGVPVEVLNVAVGGWSTQDEVVALRHFGPRFAPDLVLLVYVLNDAGYPVGVDLWEKFRHAYEGPAWLQHSYLASFFYTRLARDRAGRHYVESMVASGRTQKERWDRSFLLLSRGKAIAQRIGARYAVVLFPFLYELDESYPFLPLHEMVRSACDREAIPFADLLPAFEGRPYADLWVHPSDQHPNEEGQRIAAAAIARFVLERGLLAPRSAQQ